MDNDRSGRGSTIRTTKVGNASETPRASSTGGKAHPENGQKSSTGRGTARVQN